VATTTTRPLAADVFDYPFVPAACDVYDVDDLAPPLFTRHLLFVLVDDAPMTSLLNAINAIPNSPPGAPVGPHSALLPQTPNLEALATAGVRLRSLRVQVECSPTRATCLTGVYPFRHGIANVVNLNTTQAGDLGEFGDPGFVFPTIFNKLADAGVRTAFIGKIHQSADYNTNFNGRDGSGWQILEKIVAQSTYTVTTLRNLNQTAGDFITNGNQGSYYHFPLNYTRSNQQEILVDGAFNTSRLVDEAIGWWNTVTNDERAFMWLALNATHTPLGAAAPNTKRDFPPESLIYTQEYIDLANDEAAGGLLKSFWEDQQAHMEAVDAEAFGRLFASIPSEVRANLTVVVIGDNGHDTISIPAARTVWEKDFGDDWNFVIDNGRLKGTVYHHGSGVEAIWSGPGLGGPNMPRKGETLDIPIDAVDIPETICRYFGTSMGASDGISFFDALYVNPTIDYQTHARRDQYTETFNPNGDWHDLEAGPGANQELVQAMWSWFLPGDGFAPLGRFHLIRKRVAGAWTYELYQHYDESYVAVDPYEKVNIAGQATYAAIQTEIERRIDELLASGLGTGNAIAVEQEDLTLKYIPTAEFAGEEAIPVEQEDGTLKYIPPGSAGSIFGMPVDESGGKVVPYVSVEEQANWALRIDIETIGPFDKLIPLDQTDSLPIFNSDTGSGDKVIPSIPGTPNSILVENSDTGSGDKVLLLEAY
jgi:arylsulfatase A-like enzyme